ncbi:MAG TPA: DUF222 domain-containing protein, partial [Streptosporangiaceae bacterium]|nr:DUF222 domain-containing protein [Streptosporangiaceae bacterium]
MCTPDSSGRALAAPGGSFASVADALRVGRALGTYLNSPAAGDIDGPARGEALEQLGAITSLLGAAANGILRRFDADYDHDADGYASSAAWLAAKNRLGRRDARAAVRQMRLLARHPHLDAATTTGALTISWAREIAGWTGRIDHQELQGEADKILVDAATAGADLDDLRLIAQAAYEAWRAQEPDPDEDPRGKGFGDRDLHLETTMDGAGRIGGDLTPECAAAVTAVLEALGKRRGPEDSRTIGQRYHDALQEGCELLIRAKMVPDRAGADTRVDVTIPLSDLLEMDRASVVEDTWLRARAGQHGYLTGRDAEAAACDALIVPIVTGAPDWDLITEMITLVTDAYNHASAQPGTPLPAEAWEALQYALAKRAIRFVSGPGALASALRRSLLLGPLNTKSVILDVGYADTIPDSIRKAVIARDKGCAWPGGCDRRPAACDVHHVKHKRHGGKTSSTDCLLLCHYHHDVCVHRMGWDLELLPDGSTRA